MNRKGFMLLDALINVLVTSVICILCLSIYQAIDNYDEGYKEYIEQSNERYDYLFQGLEECIKCQLNQEEELFK